MKRQGLQEKSRAHCKVTKHGIGFFGLQVDFNICNDNDAEVSLQIANIATQALLSYRMKMMTVLVCWCLSLKCVLLLLA